MLVGLVVIVLEVEKGLESEDVDGEVFVCSSHQGLDVRGTITYQE